MIYNLNDTLCFLMFLTYYIYTSNRYIDKAIVDYGCMHPCIAIIPSKETDFFFVARPVFRGVICRISFNH